MSLSEARRELDQPGPVVIVGAGVVGVATGRGLVARGIPTSFVDTSNVKLDQLRSEGFAAYESPISEQSQPAFYLISVPTPTINGRVQLDALRSATTEVGRALRDRDGWSCVVVRSTVPPGTTDDLVLPLLEQHANKSAGTQFGLSMNPEFLRADSAERDFDEPRVIVLGVHDERTEIAMRSLYAPWADVDTVVMSNREAEATKYTANLFNAAKISFFNELHQTFQRWNIDSTTPFHTAAKGAEGLWNPLYGTRGGAPFGGACLPKDSAAFYSFARDCGIDLPVLKAVIDTNVQLGGDSLLDPQ